MAFNNKLNLLMNVQNISNVRLARALSVDPSLVSRWRNGMRIPDKNNEYIKKISSYFAEQAKMEYQKTALFEIMGVAYNNKRIEASSISNLIYIWFCDEATPKAHLVDGFLDKLNVFGKSGVIPQQIVTEFKYPSGLSLNVEVFHGNEGKREAVIRFLSEVASHSKPCTILLYSDDSMEWLVEDRSFYIKWGALLMEVIAKGHKIKIIHTITRDLSEMLSAIERWLPLYMTGSIEPYYYPKYREHIFRRTMFIAPDIAALSSNTLSDNSKNSEQFLYADKSMIKSLTDEFNTYLGMCRPLMQIFTGSDVRKINELQLEFEEQPGNCVSYSNTLSSVTMPEALFLRLLELSDLDENSKERLIRIQNERINAFTSSLKQHTYTEIVVLPTPGDISSNASLLKINDFFNKKLLSYSLSDYSEHVKNIINLIDTYKNYNFIICIKNPLQNIFLSVKEDVGVIVAKNDTSPIVFAFNQQNMIDSFNSYLEDIVKGTPQKERNRKHIKKTLLEYLDRL